MWDIYSQSYCEDSEVKIVPAHEAKVDIEKKIIYAPIDPSLSAVDAQTVGRYVKHEIGHLMFSDDIRSYKIKDNDLFYIFDALEDVRIEGELGKKYCGIKEEFQLGYKDAHDSMSKRLKILPDNAAILAYVLLQYLVGNNIDENKMHSELAKIFNQIKHKATDDFHKCTCTKDVYNLAKWIYDEYQKHKEKLQEQQQKSSEQKQKEAKQKKSDEKQEQKSKGDGKSKKQENKKEQEKDEQEKDEQEKDEQEKDEQENEKELDETELDEAEQPSIRDTKGGAKSKDGSKKESKQTEQREDTKAQNKLSKDEIETIEMIKELLDGTGLKDDLKRIAEQKTSSYDGYLYRAQTINYKGKRLLDLIENQSRGLNKYSYEKRKNPIYINSLRRLLLDVLVDKARNRDLYNLKKGRLSSRALHRVATEQNKARVFKKRIDGIENNVDLQILVDFSGSMRKSGNIQRAYDLIVNLHESLKGIKYVNYSIVGFSSKFSDSYSCMHGVVTMPTYHYEFKPFNGEALYIEQILSFNPDYNEKLCQHNNDYESIKHYSKELKKQKNSRKIMIVISDGRPEIAEISSSTMFSITQKQVKQSRKEGIEIYAFGLGGGTNLLEEIYGNENFVMIPGERTGYLTKTIQDKVAKLLVNR